jgi:hypothetical protein
MRTASQRRPLWQVARKPGGTADQERADPRPCPDCSRLAVVVVGYGAYVGTAVEISSSRSDSQSVTGRLCGRGVC